MSVFDPFIAFLVKIAGAVLSFSVVDILLIMASFDHDAIIIIKEIAGIRTQACHISVIALEYALADHKCPCHHGAHVIPLHKPRADRNHINTVILLLYIHTVIRGGGIFFLFPLPSLVLK